MISEKLHFLINEREKLKINEYIYTGKILSLLHLMIIKIFIKDKKNELHKTRVFQL